MLLSAEDILMFTHNQTAKRMDCLTQSFSRTINQKIGGNANGRFDEGQVGYSRGESEGDPKFYLIIRRSKQMNIDGGLIKMR